MSKIKWGIIGTGSIANAFAHSIIYCDHSNLISVYGRNEATLRRISKKFNIQAHSDINSLLSSKDIDAVYIATPHNSHFEYAFQSIKNKKHVLCEKPITINHIESMVLFGLAKDAEISKLVAQKTLDAVCDNIVKALGNGEAVSLVGFGTFKVKQLSARIGRNPRTGEPMPIKASKTASFKPGKIMKSAVN